jgi:predicted RNase H-like HicB family nuclease
MITVMPEPHKLRVTVHYEDDVFWATVAEFPGVFAAGDDLDELRESLQEGIAVMLARPGAEPPAMTLGALRLEPLAISAGAELLYT